MAKRSASEMTKLTAKEELFVAAFLAHSNASLAARAAGYSAKRATATGAELLARPRVAAAIQVARTRITKKYMLTAERVVEEIAVIAFSDIRHYAMTPDGHVVLTPGAPESAMRAVKRVKRKLRVVPQAGNLLPITEVDTEFELWNKDAELRAGGDYLKLFKENRAGDDDEDTELTIEQLKDRVIDLLSRAARRRRQEKATRTRRTG